MYRTFKGDSRLELITMIARSNKPEQIAHAVATYIQNKQEKGRKTSQIIPKLEELEQRFAGDAIVCEAFHKARADMGMPRSRVLPPSSNYQGPDIAGSPLTPTRRETMQSNTSLTSSSSSPYDSLESAHASTSSSLRSSTRPRGASNPLPVSFSEPAFSGVDMPRNNRRMSEHDEVPIVVPPIPQSLRLRRTSRSRGRSRSRDRVVSPTSAFSSGESDDDVLRYQRRRATSLVGRSTGAKQPVGILIPDPSRGGPLPSNIPRLAYRRRGSLGNELERPNVYSVISEDGEGVMGSESSIGHLPLDEVLDDQIEILSPQTLPPSRYSYRGIGI